MSAKIHDEFTELPVSNQRKYQLRCIRDGKCMRCGQPRNPESADYCTKHHIEQREYMRKKQGLVKRLFNAKSYHFNLKDK